jgi:hypothetical protein
MVIAFVYPGENLLMDGVAVVEFCSVCVCVCVYERERERSYGKTGSLLITFLQELIQGPRRTTLITFKGMPLRPN